MNLTLSNVEDQLLWFHLGSSDFSVHLHEFRGLTYADIEKSGSPVIHGEKVLPNRWLIPFAHLASEGNFRIESRRADKNEYPSYDGLNSKFVLAIYSAEEVRELESGSSDDL